MEWLLVAIGGGIGASLRYTVILLNAKFKYPARYATVFVNLLGSFLLGVTLQWANVDHLLQIFLVIGILGAFTTFSTFAFDLVNLFNADKLKKFIIYLLINLLGGLLLFVLGFNI